MASPPVYQLFTLILWVGIGGTLVGVGLLFRELWDRLPARSPRQWFKIFLFRVLPTLAAGLFFFLWLLAPSSLGCPSSSPEVYTVSNKCDACCPSAGPPHWSTNLYGVCGIVWGVHSLVMQEATFWTNYCQKKKDKKCSEKCRRLELKVESLQKQLSDKDKKV